MVRLPSHLPGTLSAAYRTGEECFMAKGGRTPSDIGSRPILGACNMLYDPPVFDPNSSTEIQPPK